MTIPLLHSYPLPTLADVPDTPLSWRFEPSRAALLVHDMQRYFLGFYSDGFPNLVANIAALRSRGLPVYYTRQPPRQTAAERGLLLDRWGPGLTQHEEIIAALSPASTDIVITKRRYSAFFETDFASRLREHGRDQLIITGVYAHIGITATALDAFSRNIQPFVVADAVADFDRQRHLAALHYLATTCAAITTTALLAATLAPANRLTL